MKDELVESLKKNKHKNSGEAVQTAESEMDNIGLMKLTELHVKDIQIKVYSKVLKETVIFSGMPYESDQYVVYLASELNELTVKGTTPEHLEHVHLAKKIFEGKVVDKHKEVFNHARDLTTTEELRDINNNQKEVDTMCQATYKEYLTCPQGLGTASLIEVSQTESKFGLTNIFKWEVVSDADGETYEVSEFIALEITGKNKLGKRLKAMGHDLKEMEKNKSYNLKRFIGNKCQVMIAHDLREGETYAKIESVLPLKKEETLEEEDMEKDEEDVPI